MVGAECKVGGAHTAHTVVCSLHPQNGVGLPHYSKVGLRWTVVGRSPEVVRVEAILAFAEVDTKMVGIHFPAEGHLDPGIHFPKGHLVPGIRRVYYVGGVGSHRNPPSWVVGIPLLEAVLDEKAAGHQTN
jgi:hypothetical protein